MNCAIYIRKSREEAGKDSHRLTVQRQQLPVHAQAQGWTPHVYDDGHASAARGKAENLPERSRLEADIRAGKINIILTIELSRLSRDDSMQDYTAWLHLCGEHSVKLATMSRVLDPAQHSDWMLLLMEGGFSSVEMKVLQGRMAEGRRQAFLSGKYLSGKPPAPYLYNKDLGGLQIDETQRAEVDRILTLAETQSAHSIAKQTGKAEITIRRMLADERLIMYQAKRIDPETGQTIDGQWPAIIDAERAERIRAGRRTRKTGSGIPREAASLLSNLDGLLVCGYCGHTAKTHRNSKARKDGTRLNYYGCSSCDKRRLVQQQIIDEKVIINLLGTLANTEQLKSCWLASQQNDTSGDQLTGLDREEKELTTQKQRLVQSITEGIIDFADAKDKRTEIETALNSIKILRRQILGNQTSEPDWISLEIARDGFGG
ncbi:MAG: recombinase family protein [Geopsychrobacter sp.]|nr:recombinase family protein [Geopsychrobacter sp.]